jgi:hypothetical protein
MTGYGLTIASQNSITNPNNILGAPDVTYATIGNVITVNVGANFNSISDYATVTKMTMGARVVMPGGGTMTLAFGAGDTTAYSMVIPASSTPRDFEFNLSAGALGSTTAKAGTIKVTAISGANPYNVDAVWLKVEYNEPIIGAFATSAGSPVPKNMSWWDGTRWV